jgi:hypothetical protein
MNDEGQQLQRSEKSFLELYKNRKKYVYILSKLEVNCILRHNFPKHKEHT